MINKIEKNDGQKCCSYFWKKFRRSHVLFYFISILSLSKNVRVILYAILKSVMVLPARVVIYTVM